MLSEMSRLISRLRRTVLATSCGCETIIRKHWRAKTYVEEFVILQGESKDSK